MESAHIPTIACTSAVMEKDFAHQLRAVLPTSVFVEVIVCKPGQSQNRRLVMETVPMKMGTEKIALEEAVHHIQIALVHGDLVTVHAFKVSPSLLLQKVEEPVSHKMELQEFAFQELEHVL